jgi:hypothetical protein
MRSHGSMASTKVKIIFGSTQSTRIEPFAVRSFVLGTNLKHRATGLLRKRKRMVMNSVAFGELKRELRNARTHQLTENPVAQRLRGSCVKGNGLHGLEPAGDKGSCPRPPTTRPGQ